MKIDIVVVCMNHKSFITKMLNSLFAAVNNKRFNVVVIDNNSNDGTYSFVKRNYPLVTVIKNNRCEGFAHNCNLGIKYTNSKYVLLLNPDTEIAPNAIEILKNFLETHPNVGICGPQLIFPNGKLQMSCRRFPTWKTALIRRSPFRFFFTNTEENRHHLGYDLDHSKSQPVDWLLGACMLIRRKMIKNIGLLDEKYYLYVEDIDYCYSSWKKGWEVWYVPTARVVHHHLAESDKKLFGIRSWYHFISMWYYFWKNMVKTISN